MNLLFFLRSLFIIIIIRSDYTRLHHVCTKWTRLLVNTKGLLTHFPRSDGLL